MNQLALFIAVLCCLVSASAQPIKNEPKAQKTWETTIQQVEKMNRHENSFTTKLDSVTADDEIGNLLSKIEIRKSYSTNEMVYREKLEFEYDGDKNCTAANLYDYESGSWYFEGGYEFVYDSSISINNVAGLPSF